jgi:hypothetical protein
MYGLENRYSNAFNWAPDGCVEPFAAGSLDDPVVSTGTFVAVEGSAGINRWRDSRVIE